MVSRTTSVETPQPIEKPAKPVKSTKELPSHVLFIGPRDKKDAEKSPCWTSVMGKRIGHVGRVGKVIGSKNNSKKERAFRITAHILGTKSRFFFVLSWIIPLGASKEYMQYHKSIAPDTYKRLHDYYRGEYDGSDYFSG